MTILQTPEKIDHQPIGVRMVSKYSPKTKREIKPVKHEGAPNQQRSKTMKSEKNDVQDIIDLHTKHLLQMDEILTSLQIELKEIRSVISSDKEDLIDISKVEKNQTDISWHGLIDPAREYTLKEVFAITKIPSSTLSTAKSRGQIVTRNTGGVHKWVVRGADLLAWDKKRSSHSGIDPVASYEKTSPVKTKTPVKKGQALKKSQSIPSKTRVVNPVAKTAPKNTVPKSKAKELSVPSSAKRAPILVKAPLKTPAEPKRAAKVPAIPSEPEEKTPGTQKSSQTPDQILHDIADRINALTAQKKVTQTQFGQEVDLSQNVIHEISTRKVKGLSQASIKRIIKVLKKYESK